MHTKRLDGKYISGGGFLLIRLFHFIIPLLFLLIPVISYAEGFTASTLGDYGNVSVMEVDGVYDARFADGTENRFARQQVAKEFYKTHSDDYDFLVFFSNFDYGMLDEHTVAFYQGIRNDVEGIGQGIFDHSATYGSDGKLQGTIDMGNVLNHAANYETVSDPLDPEFNDTLSTLSHEILHRWGAKLRFKDETRKVSDAMLGKDGSHWSFLFDSNGSVLYGNEWSDNGDGTFTSLASRKEMKHYGPLDLYLMGMIDKSKVPSMLLIESADVDKARLPEAGVTISGTARTVTIDDIIAAEGERNPSASGSQKSFKTAFIYVTRPGTFAAKDLVGLEDIRNSFVTRFSILTDGAAITQVAATPKDDIPTSPGVTPIETTPRTTDADINEGVAWLISQQETDGSWRDLVRTAERDTAQSYLALLNFDTAVGSLPSALEWLGLSDPANTDYLARKITALVEGGSDASAAMEKLLAMQNIDGGWGSVANYASSPADTALALKAILAADTAITEPITKGMAYLKASQNNDGGWGSGGGSDVQTTSAVLKLFGQKRDVADLDENIGSGTTWLMARQNPDGGFGNSPSTVYNTAEALLALKELDAPSQVPGAALSYLLASQSGDGSWNSSPYETALAVNAVWKASVDPDLSIKSEDITFIPEKLTSLPTSVVIKADINNFGRTDVQQARVVLYDGDAIPENKIGEQMLAFLGNSAITVTFQVTVEDGSEHRYYIVADSEGAVDEPNESNNIALKILYPEPTYDLELNSSSVILSEAVVDKFEEVTIISEVSNHGTMDAYNVLVKYYIEEEGAPHFIASENLEVVAANSTVTSNVVWKTDKAGDNMSLIVEADPFNVFAELSEENNSGTTQIKVNDLVLTDPNLVVSYNDITITPNPVNETEDIHISAIIRNNGYASAENIVVNFYRGIPGSGGLFLGSRTIEALGVGASSTLTVDWTNIQGSGEKIIYIAVDPDDIVGEIAEDDNEAFTTVQVISLPDLFVAEGSIEIAPVLPREDDQLSIAVTVQNKGGQDAKDVKVVLTDGALTIGEQIIPLVKQNSQATTLFSYRVEGKGTHILAAVVDPDHAVVEQNDGNNSAGRSFTVQGADLSASERYISPNGDGTNESTEFFFRLETAQTVKVIVVNEEGEVVRTFEGERLENIPGGTVSWDGLDDRGTVVDDGEYRISVMSEAGISLGSLSVIVDNNRTPYYEAIGTDALRDVSYNKNNEVYDQRFDFMMKEWFPDDSGILLYGEDYSSYPNNTYGFYKLSPESGEREQITPDDFESGYYMTDFSPDGSRLAAVNSGGMYDYGQLWIYDVESGEWNVVDQAEGKPSYSYKCGWYSCYKDYDFESSMLFPSWSPDGEHIIYKTLLSDNTWGLFIIRPDGTGKTRIDDSVNRIDSWEDIEYDNFEERRNYKWSPNGDRIAYYSWESDKFLVSDLEGNKTVIFYGELAGEGNFEWIDNDKLTAQFYSYEKGEFEIWEFDISNPDSSKLLLQNGESYYVSPDGAKAVFADENWPNPKMVAFNLENKSSLEINFSDLFSNFDDNDRYGFWSEMLWKTYYVGTKRFWSRDSSKFYMYYWKWNSDVDSCEMMLLTIDLNALTHKEMKVENLFGEGVYDVQGYYLMQSMMLDDNRTILLPVKLEGSYDEWTILAIDTEKGTAEKTPMRMDSFGRGWYEDNGYSPLGNYIYFNEVWWNEPVYVFQSLLNLTADLQAAKYKSEILLSGTAVDVNFGGYKLEYADINASDIWNLIQPAIDTPVIGNKLGSWVPPYEGTFNVRLIVWDKAGNTAIAQKRVIWGKSSSIANLYKSLEIFSPNSDSVKDTVELYYTVLEPVHLEFNIHDANNNLIRTFNRDHTSTGEEYISWDGRDESGNLLPDGKYRIDVANFKFFVEVDITPPDMGVAFSDIDMEIFSASLLGHVYDENILSWRVDYGEGENPQEWTEFKLGEENIAVEDIYGNILTDPVQDTGLYSFQNKVQAVAEGEEQSAYTLGWAGGKRFMVSAEDKAGNKSSQVSGFMEEKFILFQWDGNEVYADGKIPAPLTRPGVHSLRAFETVKTPFNSITLQSRSGRDWIDADAQISYESGMITIIWNTTLLADTVNAVRIKATDITGNEVYSNILTTENVLQIVKSCKTPTVAHGINYIFEPLKKLSYQVSSGGSEWTDYRVFNVETGDEIPVGSFVVPAPPDSLISWSDSIIRILATGESEREYSTEVISWPPDCAEVSLSINYPGAECGNSSGRAELSVSVGDASAGAGVIPKFVTYHMEKQEGEQMIGTVDLMKDKKGKFAVDTSFLQEGAYKVTAVASYINIKNQLQESKKEEKLIVDRVLPAAEITYPGDSLKVCPVKYDKWYGINIEGIAKDNLGDVSYEFYYGAGENPVDWQPAMTRNVEDSVPLAGKGSVEGALGTWDITGLKEDIYSLKLKVKDRVGNVSCYTTKLSFDAITDISELNVDQSLISPNGDGTNDEVAVTYTIGEYALVDINVYQGADPDINSTPVRSLAAGMQHQAGSEIVVWDGNTDSGSTVPDGAYSIAVMIKDSCGNVAVKSTTVSVDNTQPEVSISYPTPVSPLGNIIEVRGNAVDPNFKNYILEVGEGEDPETWTVIFSKDAPAKDGNILGQWNTYGVEGKWSLRLSAEDRAGNRNEVTVLIDLAERKDLIKDLKGIPTLFSPNDDGRIDNATIQFDLNYISDVVIEIADAGGIVRRKYISAELLAGVNTFTWDGKDNNDSVVPDGNYSIKLTASLSSETSVTHDESITLIVDATSPTVDIVSPVKDSYVSTDVPIRGTISDTNIFEYIVSYAGSTGEEILDQSNQSRVNYAFSSLAGLPEDKYVLKFKAFDLAENVAEETIPFTLDRTPPSVMIETPAEGAVFGAEDSVVQISGGIVEENLESFRLRYGAGDEPSQWTTIVSRTELPSGQELAGWNIGADSDISDGIYTISLYAEDKAGFTNETTLNIIIDRNPPEVEMTSPQEGEYVKKAIDVRGTATDTNFDGYTLEMSSGGCDSAYQWAVIKTGTAPVESGFLARWEILPQDGDYCLRLSSLDKLGNKSETQRNVKVDKTAPDAPVLSGTLEDINNASLSWSQSSATDLVGYNLYRDNVKINGYPLTEAAFTDSNLTGGFYKYTVKAVDLAGWESTASNEVEIEIDLTPPKAKISSPGNGSQVSGIVDIKGTAYSTDDDFKQYSLYVGDGEQPSSWNLLRNSPVPIPFGTLLSWDASALSEGVYSINLETEDLSGNKNSHSVVVTVDNTPPAAPQLLTLSLSGSSVALTWQENSEEDVAGYLLYRNDKIANASGTVTGSLKPYQLTGVSYTDQSVPDGEFDYTLVAVDEAGNMSAPSNALNVVIDMHAPSATIVDPAYWWAEFEESLTVKAESPDSDVSIVRFEYRHSSESTWNSFGEVTDGEPYLAVIDAAALELSFGNYYIRAVATDFSGKQDSDPPYTGISYGDWTSPAIPMDVTTMVDGTEITISWTANSEPDLGGYNIYKVNDDGSKSMINSADASETSYKVFRSNGTYNFVVTAEDEQNNESGYSEKASAYIYTPEIYQLATPVTDSALHIVGWSHPYTAVDIFVDSGSGPVLAASATADADGEFEADLTLSLGENEIAASAIDSSGNKSGTSWPVTVVYDEPPGAPTGLAGDVQGQNVNLTWDANPESDVKGYKIFRDGQYIATSGSGGGSAEYEEVSIIKASASSAAKACYDPRLGRVSCVPEYAIDDDPEKTAWRPEWFDLEHWLQLDFTSTEEISRIQVLWDTGTMVELVDVQVWSGREWDTVHVAESNQSEYDLKSPFNTDKIRIKVFGTRIGVADVKIYKGTASTALATAYEDEALPDGEYHYSVSAFDVYDFESPLSEEITAAVGDIIPPAIPSDLTSAVEGSDAVLNWLANTEPDLAGYNVYRETNEEWIQINHSLITGTSYTDSSLINGIHTYRVTAEDASGNESMPSSEVSADVALATLQVPVITAVYTVPEGGALDISWESPEGESAYYNLYRSMKEGSDYEKINETLIADISYLDSGLTNGTVYYYAVSAIDDIGNESSMSGEVSGVPADTLASEKPVIISPTIAGSPIVLYEGKTDVSGYAEAGSAVNLYNGMKLVGSATADEEESFIVKDVSLEAGENNLSTVAVDQSGNESPYSDEISVAFDTSLTPDLEVVSSDILFFTLRVSRSGESSRPSLMIPAKGATKLIRPN
ncbi:MAG: CARDB domain-containing protein, partial [bacterium]|nr:CARDB domain-containing protein [bacterium]